MTQIKKITVIELRTFMQTLPLTRGQQQAYLDLLGGFDFDRRGKIILLPELIDPQTHLPKEYAGTYTVADIWEHRTGEHQGDILRTIIMAAEPLYTEEGGKGPPVKVILEPRDEGIEQPTYKFLAYSAELHHDLLQGVQDTIDLYTKQIASAHEHAQNLAANQLSLLRCV